MTATTKSEREGIAGLFLSPAINAPTARSERAAKEGSP